MKAIFVGGPNHMKVLDVADPFVSYRIYETKSLGAFTADDAGPQEYVIEREVIYVPQQSIFFGMRLNFMVDHEIPFEAVQSAIGMSLIQPEFQGALW